MTTPLICPCMDEIDSEKLCVGQLAWRYGFNDCVNNLQDWSALQAWSDDYSNWSLEERANKAIEIAVRSCGCEWCKDLLARIESNRATNMLYDCHNQSDSQRAITDEFRKKMFK